LATAVTGCVILGHEEYAGQGDPHLWHKSSLTGSHCGEDMHSIMDKKREGKSVI